MSANEQRERSTILFDELLEQVKTRSNNGKATREQVYAALDILAGGWLPHSLERLGINRESAELVYKEQARSLAITIISQAIFGDDLNNDGFDDADDG